MGYLIFFLPVIIGAIIALINNPKVDNNVTKFEDWLSYRKQKITPNSGKLNRFLFRPFLWLGLKIKEWTNTIAHSGVRSGLRITLYIYSGGLFIYFFIVVLYFFVMFAILVAIFAIIGIGFWIYSKFTSDTSSIQRVYDKTSFHSRDEEVIDYVGLKGKKIYSGTNWLNEELKGRVDDDGNIYRGTNWISEEKIGRMDNDGNIYQGTNSMNETKVGRIDKEGNIHKGTNWLNEEKTGRIDGDGNVFKGSGWLNEEKQGRSGN